MKTTMNKLLSQFAKAKKAAKQGDLSLATSFIKTVEELTPETLDSQGLGHQDAMANLESLASSAGNWTIASKDKEQTGVEFNDDASHH